jgi:hypothetical protein
MSSHRDFFCYVREEEDGTEQIFIRCTKCAQEFEDDDDFVRHLYAKPGSSRMVMLVALILSLDLLIKMSLVLGSV